MPRLGDYSYPLLKFTRAVAIVERICQPPYKGELSVSSLASELKMAEKGGAFTYLVAALRDYGLVEGRETLRATELAKRIVAGGPEESTRAKAEAFLRVELFRKIREKAGLEVPDEERFANLLRDITRADPLLVKNRAKEIKDVYSDGLRYVRDAEVAASREAGAGVAVEPTQPSAVAAPERLEGFEELKGPLGVWIRLPVKGGRPTKEGIAIARGLIDLAEKSILQASEEEIKSTG